MSRSGTRIRHNVVGYLALFIALTMGSAYASEHLIGTDDIENGAVTTPKIANQAVTNQKIAAQTIQGNRIANEAVSNHKIAPEAVQRGRIAPGAVGNQKIADGAVDSAKVLDDSLTADDLNLATMPFWRVGGNAGTTAGTDFVGTTDDQALDFRVNNRRGLRLSPHALGPNLIGGHGANSVTPGVSGATISGGGGPGEHPDYSESNHVTDRGGTIGGGFGNQAGDGAGTTTDRSVATVGGGTQNRALGSAATVAGGAENHASGRTSAVGGGWDNVASGVDSTIAGGNVNFAPGDGSTIGGGAGNEASGDFSTVAGGFANAAAGDASFVAGRRAWNADSAHDGVFLFGDHSTNALFHSEAANEFAVRASGGVRLRTSSNLSTGCDLAAGSGTWSCTSDRDSKHNFEAVDGETVLSRLAELPITTWSFRSDGTATRHMGPTAQDFYAAFGLGSDEKTISSVDADGVALAAIKALKKENDELRQRVEALEDR